MDKMMVVGYMNSERYVGLNGLEYSHEIMCKASMVWEYDYLNEVLEAVEARFAQVYKGTDYTKLCFKFEVVKGVVQVGIANVKEQELYVKELRKEQVITNEETSQKNVVKV